MITLITAIAALFVGAVVGFILGKRSQPARMPDSLATIRALQEQYRQQPSHALKAKIALAKNIHRLSKQVAP